jgi:hypothetical protein
MVDVVVASMIRCVRNMEKVGLVSACTAMHGSSGIITSLIGFTIFDALFIILWSEEYQMRCSDDEIRTTMGYYI